MTPFLSANFLATVAEVIRFPDVAWAKTSFVCLLLFLSCSWRNKYYPRKLMVGPRPLVNSTVVGRNPAPL